MRLLTIPAIGPTFRRDCWGGLALDAHFVSRFGAGVCFARDLDSGVRGRGE